MLYPTELGAHGLQLTHCTALIVFFRNRKLHGRILAEPNFVPAQARNRV